MARRLGPKAGQWSSCKRLAALIACPTTPAAARSQAQRQLLELNMGWRGAQQEPFRSMTTKAVVEHLRQRGLESPVLTAIGEECKAQLKIATSEAIASWQAFARESVAKGGRIAHRVSKGPKEPPPVVLGRQEVPVEGHRGRACGIEWPPPQVMEGVQFSLREASAAAAGGEVAATQGGRRLPSPPTAGGHRS